MYKNFPIVSIPLEEDIAQQHIGEDCPELFEQPEIMTLEDLYNLGMEQDEISTCEEVGLGDVDGRTNNAEGVSTKRRRRPAKHVDCDSSCSSNGDFTVPETTSDSSIGKRRKRKQE